MVYFETVTFTCQLNGATFTPLYIIRYILLLPIGEVEIMEVGDDGDTVVIPIGGIALSSNLSARD